MTAHQQTTDGNQYATTYTYNLSGALMEETYPNGRVVRNTLDANGELSQVSSQKNSNFGFQNYAGAFTYTAAGAVSSMRLGNGKWESTVFNSRLQPTQIALGNVQNSNNLLKLDYSYNTTGNTDNNGNVISQTITAPTVGAQAGFTATQTYSYDSLNRIKSAQEIVGSTQTWKQTFNYDRFGNKTFDAANTTTLGSCVQAQCNPSVDAANNRLTTAQGYVYDLSGNVITDAEGRTFVYDAENKQTEVRDASNSVIGQYFYDGNGKRVKKYVPGTGETTVFVYDAEDKLIAEYSTQLSANPQVSYLTTDALGSPRIKTNANGNVISRNDYLPFGEDLFTSQRTQGVGYNSDDIRRKFTTYKRDDETGLDYAEARYYSSRWGRFVSPDEFTGGPDELFDFTDDASENPTFYADLTNPQSLNKYQYTYNNPLNLTDSDGHCPPCDTNAAPALQMPAPIFLGAQEYEIPPGFNTAGDFVKATADVGAKLGETIGKIGRIRVPTATVDIPIAGIRGQAGLRPTAMARPNTNARSPKPQAPGSRAGKSFTPKGKNQVKTDNMAKNGGKTRCEKCGIETIPAEQSNKGVTPPPNETHIDHIDPKANGGSGTPENGQVLCHTCNLTKGSKVP